MGFTNVHKSFCVSRISSRQTFGSCTFSGAFCCAGKDFYSQKFKKLINIYLSITQFMSLCIEHQVHIRFPSVRVEVTARFFPLHQRRQQGHRPRSKAGSDCPASRPPRSGKITHISFHHISDIPVVYSLLSEKCFENSK